MLSRLSMRFVGPADFRFAVPGIAALQDTRTELISSNRKIARAQNDYSRAALSDNLCIVGWLFDVPQHQAGPREQKLDS